MSGGRSRSGHSPTDDNVLKIVRLCTFTPIPQMDGLFNDQSVFLVPCENLFHGKSDTPLWILLVQGHPAFARVGMAKLDRGAPFGNEAPSVVVEEKESRKASSLRAEQTGDLRQVMIRGSGKEVGENGGKKYEIERSVGVGEPDGGVRLRAGWVVMAIADV